MLFSLNTPRSHVQGYTMARTSYNVVRNTRLNRNQPVLIVSAYCVACSAYTIRTIHDYDMNGQMPLIHDTAYDVLSRAV